MTVHSLGYQEVCMKDNYRFKGVKLTANVFKELLILLFDGKQFERQKAIENIATYHLENGGIIEDGRNLVSVFKKATKLLRESDSGLINKSYGTWELHYKIKELKEIVEPTEKGNDHIVDETLGLGINAVYLYYYDVYKELAQIQGELTWPCKIGRTDRDPIQRIVSQAGTCHPELPHIALLIYCDDSSKLEDALHSILRFQNKWMNNSPGKEWFLTSPDEVKAIYLTINGDK